MRKGKYFNSSVKIGSLTITPYRTLRVPRERGMVSELPAGLGEFPVYSVQDYRSTVPSDWHQEGYFMPMYSHEALWIGLQAATPVALLVGAGMVNAVTGERLEPQLSGNPQNYLVIPPQPWLDGFKPTQGEKVFQFVAAELGKGETAEEQILGTAEFGGLQFGLFTSKVPLYTTGRPNVYNTKGLGTLGSTAVRTRGASRSTPQEMGLGAGGAIRQKIYPDPHVSGRRTVQEVWNDTPAEKAYIYFVHANDWRTLTGESPPPSPITRETYKQAGYSWFGLADGRWGDVEGGQNIDQLKPVSDPKGKNNDIW